MQLLASLGQTVDDPVRQGDRQRHQFGSLIAGIAEHQTLIASSFAINAHRDVGALAVDGDEYLAGLVMEAHVVKRVSDILHDIANDLNVVELALGGDLTRQHNQVGRTQRLAGDARTRILSQQRIQHAIGDLVSHLVRVAHADGLAGEEMVRHLTKPSVKLASFL